MSPENQTLRLRAPSVTTTVASLLLAGMVGAAHGDCARDARGEVLCGAGHCDRDYKGEVWCSRFEDGGVARTRLGAILCGKGICQKTFTGEVYCSSVVGGDAIKDSRGRVRCEGRCEPARLAHCERSVADIAD